MASERSMKTVNVRIDCNSSVTLEDFGDGAKNLVPDYHIFTSPILGTLWDLELEVRLAILLFAHCVFFLGVCLC